MKDYKARHGPKGRKPARPRPIQRGKTRPVPLAAGFVAPSQKAAPRRAERRGRLRALLAAAWAHARTVPIQAVLLVPALAWLLVGLLVGGLALWRAPLAEVRLSGRDAVAAETVLERAGLSAGLALRDVDSFAAAARIAAHPRVLAADVRRLYPHRVAIRVTERSPALRVRLADGRVAVVDADDTVLAILPRGTGAPPDLSALPLVTGVRAGATLTEVLRDPALTRGRGVLAVLARQAKAMGTPPAPDVTVESGDPFLLSLRLPGAPRLVVPYERLALALRTYAALRTRVADVLEGAGVLDFSALDAQGSGRLYLRRR